MLSLLHYVQAKEEDLPPFPLEQWGEPPVVEEGGEGGWTRDIAFSVREISNLVRRVISCYGAADGLGDRNRSSTAV
jgi:hypothetical protein